MENGTVQKGQNLLEDFVWPIDTGRLMGDPSYLSIRTDPVIPSKRLSSTYPTDIFIRNISYSDPSYFVVLNAIGQGLAPTIFWGS